MLLTGRRENEIVCREWVCFFFFITSCFLLIGSSGTAVIHLSKHLLNAQMCFIHITSVLGQ